MIDYKEIISNYYVLGSNIERLLMVHSEQVADLAVHLAKRYGTEKIDADFVFEASMLHDIGVFKTYAPSIFCEGTEPYIKHGIIGYDILMTHNLPKHARVCARHTGAGLSANEIIAQNLPLPAIDFLPETIEEKLVCYADKFFSKSKVSDAKSVEVVRMQMAKFGQSSLNRFNDMVDLFGTP